MGLDPRFMGQVPQLGLDPGLPSKADMRRATAISVVQNFCLGEHAPVKLDPAPEKAGEQIVNLAKKVEKYLDSGN